MDGLGSRNCLPLFDDTSSCGSHPDPVFRDYSCTNHGYHFDFKVPFNF